VKGQINMEMGRRKAVKTIALGGLAMTTMGAWAGEKKSPKELVFDSGEIKPVPLPFNPRKLNGISEPMIQSHWENNYGGSVKALNVVNKQLKDAFANKETASFIIGELKREQLLRTGSVVNHDLYFENLGGNGKSIRNAMSLVFGSENNWETQFRKIAVTLSGGSGWVILGYNYHLKVLENYWCHDHLHAPAATIPMLVMDMYEHSYQMDYGAAAAKYIEAFFKNINWDIVNHRFEKNQL
jgi:superoxide dismutase, Fe-Mn family